MSEDVKRGKVKKHLFLENKYVHCVYNFPQGTLNFTGRCIKAPVLGLSHGWTCDFEQHVLENVSLVSHDLIFGVHKNERSD
jgi:hypothetical protein